MRRWLWLLLLIALHTQAGEPLVRLQTEPQGVLAPGQSLTVQVQLLVPSYFLSAPVFPELSLSDGSRALPAESLNLNTRIAGQDYAGIQRSYHFPPLATGQYRLNPESLTLRYADEHSAPLEAQLELPELSIDVVPGTSSAPQVALEPQLRISERYQPASENLHTGDILRRELRIELQDAGTLLPPSPPLADVPGTRLYRSAPELSHDEQRGARSSVRVEEVRYLITEPGEIKLPPLRLQWRDTRTGLLQQLELPARRLQVEEPTQSASTGIPGMGLWLISLGATLLATTLALRSPWLRQRYAERGRWNALRRAARSGDALGVELALEAWLDELPAARRQTAHTALASEIDALMRARYAPDSAQWSPAGLLRQASGLRGRRVIADGLSSQPRRLNP